MQLSATGTIHFYPEMWEYTLLLELACYPKQRYSHFHLQKKKSLEFKI